MDPNSKELPNHHAIRITLKRDLSQKYHRYSGDTRTDTQYESLPDFTTQEGWDVAGTFDFLEAVPIPTFEEIGKERDCHDLVSWQTEKDLILIPFSGETIPSWGDDLCHPNSRVPLCVIWKITLSPAAHEIGTDYKAVLGGITGAKQLINETVTSHISDATNYGLFQCLGGPDLVAVFLAQDPLQLESIHLAMLDVKELPLTELRNAIDNNLLTDNDYDRPMPGHALVRLEPVFAFQLKELSHYAGDEFRTKERQTQLRLISRIRVDCGHENNVTDRLREVCERNGARCQPIAFDPIRELLETLLRNSDSPEKMAGEITKILDEAETATKETWNEFTVEISIGSIADFVRIWEECYFNRVWRNGNLLGSETAVCFPNPLRNTRTKPSAAWQLSAVAMDALDVAGNSVRDYGQAFYSGTQRNELLHVYNTFRSCFFRMELFTAARDLLPFFTQLGNAMRSTSMWGAFLNPGIDRLNKRATQWRERYSDSVATLSQEIHRAVRNRIEQRSILADPPLAHTLQYGASKLINAYSAVFWICGEIFRRGAPDVHDECWPGHFGGCVVAGGAGYVKCQELFGDFRREVEEGYGMFLSENSVSDEEWTARLLVLDISGDSLFLPETCFIHCLHEIAELSEWIALPQSAYFRHVINTWITGEVVANLYGTLKKDFGVEHDKEEKAFCAAFVMYCVSKQFDESTVASSTMSIWDRVLTTSTPEAYIDLVAKSLREVGTKISSFGESSLVNTGSHTKSPDDPGLWCNVLASDVLIESLDCLKLLVSEVVADTGMWAAFDRLRVRFQQSTRPRSVEDRFNDLSRIFVGMLKLSRSATGDSVLLDVYQQTTVRRWSAQVAALNDSVFSIDKIAAEIQNAQIGISILEVQKLIEHAVSSAVTTNVNADMSLPGGLSDLTCYGGAVEFDLPSVEMFNEIESELLSDVIRTWDEADVPQKSAARAELAMKFWAKSLLLPGVRMLEPVEGVEGDRN